MWYYNILDNMQCYIQILSLTARGTEISLASQHREKLCTRTRPACIFAHRRLIVSRQDSCVDDGDAADEALALVVESFIYEQCENEQICVTSHMCAAREH